MEEDEYKIMEEMERKRRRKKRAIMKRKERLLPDALGLGGLTYSPLLV
jgi:hypothetical protein